MVCCNACRATKELGMLNIGQLRNFNNSDLPAVIELSTLAGWNQTADDWRMLLELAPDGCFGMEVGGHVVSTATLLSYGDRLGWIGMVLTHPEFRHQGFARELFERVLAIADSVGVKTLKLDATDQGQHLYESYGFKSEQAIERWFRPGSLAREISEPSVEFTKLHQLDREAFGADRSKLLEKLARRGRCCSDSAAYAFSRPGRSFLYLGPCVAESGEAARQVLEMPIGEPNAGGWFWDLLPSNQNAVALASELGFSPQRRLTRMFRGEELKGNDQLVYAIAGFELG